MSKGLTPEEYAILRNCDHPISVTAMEVMQNAGKRGQLLDLLLRRAEHSRSLRPEPRRPFLELD